MEDPSLGWECKMLGAGALRVDVPRVSPEASSSVSPSTLAIIRVVGQLEAPFSIAVGLMIYLTI